MEAIERVGKQHDSFEEVDRILTIVETNYEEYDKTSFTRSNFLFVMLVYLGLIIFGFFLVNEYKVISDFSSKHLLDTKNLVVISMNILLLASGSWLAFHYIKMQNKRKTYLLTRDQAIEVLREVVPVVSRRENWSALQKFELRLRLSKLDISPEGILGEKQA